MGASRFFYPTKYLDFTKFTNYAIFSKHSLNIGARHVLLENYNR